MEGEEQEALFSSPSPCTAVALYYVQSPSTASQAHSDRNASSESALLSPFHPNRTREASTLSRYSSSRGSNNSFLPEKKSVVLSYDAQSRDSILKSGRLRIIDEVADTGRSGNRGLWRFIALDPSSHFCCIVFQILWRLAVSIGIALLVFFLMTKPPAPRVSFEVVGFREFSLGEGLDGTGVGTKILSSNCSVDMVIDNNSKVFGLHVEPPVIEMAFGRLKLAQSQGPETYVGSKRRYVLRLSVGVRDRPVYGAGRGMQDMLESGRGLPLIVRVRSRSSYRVVWGLIKMRYMHHEECVLVLTGEYDRKRHIHIHHSTCSSSYHP